MKFGVIYSATVFGDPLSPDRRDRNTTSIKELSPDLLKHRKTWSRTEAGKAAVAGDYPDELPVQSHGKWCALLTKPQFRDFVREFGFNYRSRCDTMGAIGMPGSPNGYECMPAWSFDSDAYRGCIVNVYVTPYPDVKVKAGTSCTEKNIGRILSAMAELF